MMTPRTEAVVGTSASSSTICGSRSATRNGVYLKEGTSIISSIPSVEMDCVASRSVWCGVVCWCVLCVLCVLWCIVLCCGVWWCVVWWCGGAWCGGHVVVVVDLLFLFLLFLLLFFFFFGCVCVCVCCSCSCGWCWVGLWVFWEEGWHDWILDSNVFLVRTKKEEAGGC